MRKLQHQHSCKIGTEQTREGTEGLGEESLEAEGLGRQKEVRTFDGKILLLEERSKNLHHFYSNKISQLRTILSKQNETKDDLLQEIQKLAAQSQRQKKYVAQLKDKLEAGSQITAQGSNADGSSQAPHPSIEKNPLRRGSKHKQGLLFSSNSLGTSSNRVLKKSKSEQYF